MSPVAVSAKNVFQLGMCKSKKNFPFTILFLLLATACSHQPQKTTLVKAPTVDLEEGVTDEEFRDHACDYFQYVDKNGDGRLSNDETAKLPSWMGEIQAASPERQVTIIDVVEAADRKFKSHAKSKKDSLTVEEFNALQKGR
ncbi:hypothetical protein [Bdellovibrio bacteriovorus]|uniref:hypothetical protein n=1 Tax=Bdellovibrio bacteriovorus TaxID=959 RepID=UPI0035A623A7